MFGELPKLLDRNFVIGYFLPLVAFVVVSYGLIATFGLSLPAFLTSNNVLVNTTIATLASWLLAVLLLAANRPIYMLKEGYGRLNPAQLLKHIERKRYDKYLREKAELENKLKKSTVETEKRTSIKKSQSYARDGRTIS